MNIPLRSQGIIFVISSPSGAGKSSVCGAILNSDPRLQLSISGTTRPPRVGETDGVDYHFYSEDEFSSMINDEEFIEHATIYENQYGTPKSPVLNALSEERDVLFDVDTQGMTAIKSASLTQTVSIFILPPSIQELESRLRNRNQDSEEVMQRRLAMAEKEVQLASLYDYVVINDDFCKTVDAVQSIVIAERYNRNSLDRLTTFIDSL